MNEQDENRVEQIPQPEQGETVYPEVSPQDGGESGWIEGCDKPQVTPPATETPPPWQPPYMPPYMPPQGQNTWPAYPVPPQAGGAQQPPVQGYPYPGYMPYTMPYYQPPKKKMKTGTKVFLWVASVLAGLAILSFVAYVGFIAVHGIASGALETEREYDDWSYSIPSPYEPDEEEPDESEETPDFDEDVETPDADEPLPEVDVTPNNDGIEIHAQPTEDAMSVKEAYQRVIKSTVTVAVTLEQNGASSTGTGTGIIATSDGYIITNSHVVMNSKSSRVKITTYDGEEYDAVVVGVDRTTDLAILKTNDYQFTPAEFGDTDAMEIGDEVIAIGNPGGAKFSGSLTVGYVSGLDRAVGKYSESGMTYLQTDAAINPGNSGGPLVNCYGQVIAINSSKIVADGYEGMAFAIPVSKAKPIIDQLLSGGYVKGRVRLGISGQNITDSNFYGYNIATGFLIVQIDEDSAFQGTDAQPGDIITALNGEEISNLEEMSNLLLKYSPGDEVTITLNRNGKSFDVVVTLLEDKGETQK